MTETNVTSVSDALEKARTLMAKVNALEKAYTMRGMSKAEREEIKKLLDPAKAELDQLLSAKVS